MIEIPFRERGYAVERATLVVHERYADHAPGAQRTSPQGMANIVDTRGVPCPVCFPPPPRRAPPTRGGTPRTVLSALPEDPGLRNDDTALEPNAVPRSEKP